MRLTARLLTLTLFLAAGAIPARAEFGLALYGEPKYQPGFEHFDYVNPEAPKGGSVVLSAIGSYDTLNPYTIKGVAAAGLGSIYDTLMTESLDEPFSQYPLLAEKVELAPDRSWIAYDLRPEARFHDGQPVTAEDVVFTFNALRENHPFYRNYYANVAEVQAEGERRVVFRFQPGDNRELALIIGQLPVLPAHYWKDRDLSATTLDPPLGSGPYRIARVDPGRSITYERVEDYWGADLPVNVGRHNFGTIRYDYYRDTTVALEAFKAGLVDFRVENTAKNWATAYKVPEVQRGQIILEEIEDQTPAGMQGYAFNTRRPIFQDPKVRRALAHAFDFEWTNEQLFYGAYERTDSYFENSELQARGLPSPAELEILEPLRDKVPEEVFLKTYEPPSTEGPGGIRRNLLTARQLLDEAGWVLRDNVRVHAETGIPLRFEILLSNPTFERVTLPFVSNLRRLGIIADVRTVDTTQYVNRVQNFDFDMVVAVWPQSLNPGNEQREFWGTEAADTPGSRNLAGIKNEAVDRIIDRIVAAQDRESFKAAVAALDRVLLWGHYVIPHWYSENIRVAYWQKLAHPDPLPPYGLAFDAWWVDGENLALGGSQDRGQNR